MTEAFDLSTANYRLRLMTPPMVTDRWLAWTADRALMAKLNSKPRKLKKLDLQRYVAAAIANQRAIVGIFASSGNDHAGIYELSLDRRHKIASLDVLIDLKRFSLHDVLSETDPPLLAWLQKRFGIQKAVVVLPATYTDAIRHFEKAEWMKEGLLRAEYPSAAASNERVDAVQFGRLLI